jgi:hypothetical protein
MATKVWFCYEGRCRAQLGIVVNGELTIQKREENVMMMTTEGAILNVHCSKCGRINKWVPKDRDLIQAVLRTHLISAFILEVSNIFAKGTLKAEVEAEKEKESVKDDEEKVEVAETE